MASYLAGTSGGLKAARVVASLATDTVSFSGLTTAHIAEITKWGPISDRFMGEAPKSLTLYSTASAEGVIYPDAVRGGASQWTCPVQFQFNTENADFFRNGAFFLADLLGTKNVEAGRPNCKCRVVDFQNEGPGTQVGTQMGSATLEGFGPLPAWA